MENRPVLWVVGTRLVVPEQREGFNRWYEEHLGLILKSPGIMGATRYERIPLPGEEAAPEYLAVYQFANEASIQASEGTPERLRVTAHRQESWGDQAPFETILKGHYRPIRPW